MQVRNETTQSQNLWNWFTHQVYLNFQQIATFQRAFRNPLIASLNQESLSSGSNQKITKNHFQRFILIEIKITFPCLHHHRPSPTWETEVSYQSLLILFASANIWTHHLFLALSRLSLRGMTITRLSLQDNPSSQGHFRWL